MRVPIRRTFSVLVLTVFAMSLGVFVRAQEQPKGAKPPAAKPTPIVTVTKADGSTVRGKLVASDPDKLTVEPAPAAAGAAAGAAVDIPWREVAKVSNGLTQAKAVEQFKADHAGQLCDTCRGDRSTPCATCKGTAHDPASGKDCKTCSGSLLVNCKTPKCTAGKVPCPKPCLKLTEGAWTTQQGQKVRTFKLKGGASAWFSEAHVGEVIYVKNGDIVNEGKCTTCGGTTTVACLTCGGNGKATCPTCVARKDAPPCTAAGCDHGRTPCVPCGGKGLK